MSDEAKDPVGKSHEHGRNDRIPNGSVSRATGAKHCIVHVEIIQDGYGKFVHGNKRIRSRLAFYCARCISTTD